MSDKQEAVIFDLDGTLCNVEHRLHLLPSRDQRKKNYDEFNAACVDDTSKNDIRSMLVCFRATGYRIILCSGRSDKFLRHTECWLYEQKIFYDELLMRAHGDYRPDATIKETLYREHIEPKYNILVVVDDRQRVVDMWRSLGLTCLQCQPGDY